MRREWYSKILKNIPLCMVQIYSRSNIPQTNHLGALITAIEFWGILYNHRSRALQGNIVRNYVGVLVRGFEV